MIKRAIGSLALLALVAGAGELSAQSGSFQVVVNAANPAETISRGELSKIFLKKAAEWQHGVGVAVADLGKGSSVRQSFSEAVHGRSTSSITSYWQQQIFSGAGYPPDEMESEEEVLSFVRSEPGAVGYVSASSSLGDGVKALTVVE